MKKTFKSTKGITLIALVVTIVVLLILAGVSVNALFGNSGIINKAKEAKELYEQKRQEESEEINKLNEQLGQYINKNGTEDENGDTPEKQAVVKYAFAFKNSNKSARSPEPPVDAPYIFLAYDSNGEDVYVALETFDVDVNEIEWLYDEEKFFNTFGVKPEESKTVILWNASFNFIDDTAKFPVVIKVGGETLRNFSATDILISYYSKETSSWVKYEYNDELSSKYNSKEGSIELTLLDNNWK